MSIEQGFPNVPGLPDGWELVHACRQAQSGEYYLNNKGYLSFADCRTSSSYAIIRKIEKPAEDRLFANSKEAEPFWDEALRLAKPCGQSANTRFRICVMTDKGIRIGLDFYSYAIAFERFVCADGTPFGVKVDE